MFRLGLSLRRTAGFSEALGYDPRNNPDDQTDNKPERDVRKHRLGLRRLDCGRHRFPPSGQGVSMPSHFLEIDA